MFCPKGKTPYDRFCFQIMGHIQISLLNFFQKVYINFLRLFHYCLIIYCAHIFSSFSWHPICSRTINSVRVIEQAWTFPLILWDKSKLEVTPQLVWAFTRSFNHKSMHLSYKIAKNIYLLKMLFIIIRSTSWKNYSYQYRLYNL